MRFIFRADGRALARELTARTGGRLRVRFCPALPIPDPRDPKNERLDRLSLGWVFTANVARVDRACPEEGFTSFTIDARRGDVATQLATQLRRLGEDYQELAAAVAGKGTRPQEGGAT